MNWNSTCRWSILSPGQSIGSSYLVDCLIGSGYEGEVYKVREVGTGIERALKLYYPKRNPNGKTLRRYAHKLRKLDHIESILQYHHRNCINVNGRKLGFMISELVRGKLLSKLLFEQPGKRFSSSEALQLLRAIAQSVAPIHLANEYHGDLHTKNIIVQRNRVGFDVKLLDFYDLGRPTKRRMEEDVVDLANILYELIGGCTHYKNASPAVKQIVRGRKHSLILRNCRDACGLLKLINSLDCF